MSKYAWHMQKNSGYIFYFNNSQDVFWSSKKEFLWWEFPRQGSFSYSARMLTICQTCVPQVVIFPSFHLLCYRKTKWSLQLNIRFLPNFNIFWVHHVFRADLCFTHENFYGVKTSFLTFQGQVVSMITNRPTPSRHSTPAKQPYWPNLAQDDVCATAARKFDVNLTTFDSFDWLAGHPTSCGHFDRVAASESDPYLSLPPQAMHWALTSLQPLWVSTCIYIYTVYHEKCSLNIKGNSPFKGIGLLHTMIYFYTVYHKKPCKNVVCSELGVLRGGMYERVLSNSNSVIEIYWFIFYS